MDDGDSKSKKYIQRQPGNGSVDGCNILQPNGLRCAFWCGFEAYRFIFDNRLCFLYTIWILLSNVLAGKEEKAFTFN